MGTVTFETSRAWIELDMDNLRHNVSQLQGLLPPGCVLMPALKANAYGHGAALVARELEQQGVQDFCVATAQEGAELRRFGIQGKILILGYTHPLDFGLLAQYHLTQTVLDYAYAELLNGFGERLHVHVAVDTGMHRIGESWEDFDRFLAIFSMRNLLVTGVFTHLCTDDGKSRADKVFTYRQAAAFRKVVEGLRQHGYRPKAHILGSYGLLRFPALGGDYARVGIALYGVLSRREDLEDCPVSLRPVLSLKARVAMTRTLRAGDGLGYGLEYVADQERRVAVVTIGYGDGLPRSLSGGQGAVLLHGKEAPVLGRICMDQMMVDITDIPLVVSGDVAVIVGRSGDRVRTVYDLAEAAGTITNEIVSRLGNRLARISCRYSGRRSPEHKRQSGTPRATQEKIYQTSLGKGGCN